MQNRVSGRIVRADNGFGIPNLKIAIFDIDTVDGPEIGAASGVHSPELFSTILSAIYGRSNKESIGVRGDAPAGDRIGSVLTKQDGSFELEFADEAFQQGNDKGERRPDLFVLVIGPDKSTVVNGTGLGQPESQRIVHLTMYPRWNAGRQETFFVEIPTELFSKAGLNDLEEQEDTRSPAQVLLEEHEKAEKERAELAGVREKIAERRTEELVDEQKKSNEVTKRLIASSRLSVTRPNFLGADISMSQRPKLRDEAINSAIANGLDRLGNIGVKDNAGITVPHVRPLFIPEDLLRPKLPPGVDLSAPQSYPVTVDTVCGMINLSSGGRSLVRTRSIKDSLTNALDENGGEDEKISDTNPPIELVPTEGEAANLTAQQRIQQIVEEQIRDVAISQPADPTMPASTLARLHADLDNAVIAPGPADTTSFHDFHTLQIAFEDVWSESLSGQYRSIVSSLYNATVRDNQSFQDTPPVDPVLLEETDSIESLIDFATTTDTALNEVLTSSIDAPSKHLFFLIPDIMSFWPQLSPNQRLEADRLAVRSYAKDFHWTVLEKEFKGTPPEQRRRFERHLTADEAHGYDESLPDWENEGFINKVDELVAARIDEIQLYLDANLQALNNNGDDEPKTRIGSRLRRLLDDFSKISVENYRFEHFETGSINFGIISTYRQTWEPGNYQVGSLVKTIPLAPGEERSFTVKKSRRTSRVREEAEKNARSRSSEANRTARLEDEIVERAEQSNSFSNTTEASFKFKSFADVRNTTSFQDDQKRHSQETKRGFREAILKSAQEVKSETSFEVKFTEEFSFEETENGTLKNPNNEVTVTYLLYELERQYKISEKIHALTPVIMVAQEMPKPDDITEAWLLRYDWILKRALLDESFRPAIGLLRENFVANEVSIAVKKANWETQIAIVSALRGETSELLSEKKRLQEALITAEYNEDRAEAASSGGGLFHRLAKAITPFDPLGAAEGLAEAKATRAKSLLEVAEKEFTTAAEKLANAREALNSAAREYSEAVEGITQRRTLIDQLRIHVKDNILYYMQAIWSYEPEDQRYFRLYRNPVLFPQATRTELTVRAATSDDVDSVYLPGVPHPNVVVEGLSPPEWNPEADDQDWHNRPLHEVADIDNPVGFKGNYMMFPLKECCVITDFMMAEFVDGYFGIRDPDALSEFTNEELAEQRRKLEREADGLRAVPGGENLANKKQAEADLVQAIIGKRLDSTYRDVDEIALPTGQLYMEALIGSNTLLEPFKLAHRGYDALSAREELRRKGLENLRYAQRMVGDNPDLDDPEVEKYIKVDGDFDSQNIEVE